MDIAKERGYSSKHASRIKTLKGKSDRTVTQYALERDMIVVTNNLVDFEAIYQKTKNHPGLIFISASGNLINRQTHIQLFEAALDELEEDPPINEAIHVHLEEDKLKNVNLILERYTLP